MESSSTDESTLEALRKTTHSVLAALTPGEAKVLRVRFGIDMRSEHTLESVGTPGRRHRIEHLEVTSPGDAQRLSDLGITASVQAVHADPTILRAWPNLLGQERCDRAFAYREFLDHGAPLALGTDAPTAPHMPLANLYIATTRKSAKKPSLADTVNEHFVLPLASAVSAATAGSAYSSFAETQTGSLEAGKKADFAVLDIKWKPEELLEAVVVETWLDGKRVFERTTYKKETDF